MITLEEAAHVSEIATGFAALGALGLGIWQVKHAERFTRSQDAYRAYDNYVQTCIARPEFGSYDMARAAYDLPDPAHIWDVGTLNSERYLWFLANMLNCFEQVVLASPRSIEWKRTIKSQIEYHKPVIAAVWYDRWKTEYSSPLCELVEDVIGKSANA